MKSDLPKVLHPVANRPMVSHIISALEAVSPDRTVVVVAPGMDRVADAVAPADTAIQAEALGTGHAVLSARDAMRGFEGDVLVLFGDTPLLTAETIQSMLSARRAAENPAVVVLGLREALLLRQRRRPLVYVGGARHAATPGKRAVALEQRGGGRRNSRVVVGRLHSQRPSHHEEAALVVISLFYRGCNRYAFK